MPVDDMEIKDMQCFIINDDGSHTQVGSLIGLCNVEFATTTTEDSAKSFNILSNSATITATLDNPKEFRAFIRGLTSKMDRRLIHNALKHRSLLVRKKSIKRLIKKGYEVVVEYRVHRKGVANDNN